jgi:hypothetical protein
VVLGVIVQLGVAAALLTGVATFTGIIDWSRLVRLAIPEGVPATPDAPQRTGQPARDEGTPLVERAFQALPPPQQPGRSAQPPGCNVADSARLSRLNREHRDWGDEVSALVSCRQVRPGFNVDQLRAAMGRPAKVVRSDSGGEEWIYNHLKVVVKDGQVTAVEH